MNIKIKTALIVFLLPVSTLVEAQSTVKAPEIITEPAIRSNWIYFKTDQRINTQTVFEEYKTQFGLQQNDELQLIKTYTNPLTGITQHRFQQYFNNIPVHGGMMCVYEKDGIAIKANGRLVKNLNASKHTVISESVALQQALNYLPASDYAWLNTKREANYKIKKNNPSATLYPVGELVYMKRKNTNGFDAANFVLCYEFKISMERSTSFSVFIDAQTGEVINSIPLSTSCNAATTQTPYNGTRTIYTSQQGRCATANEFELWNDCSAADIKVESDDFGAGTDDPFCTGSNNDWSNPTGIRADAVQVHWGMKITVDYYNNNFSWFSYDNGGGSVDCTVAFAFEDAQGNPTGNNAQYNEFEEDFDFGWGSSGLDATDSYTCLDIVSHEFTHGFDDYSADLDYSDESGALDESFADIMGEFVEMATDLGLDTTLWRHGEDKGGYRSFSNPNNSDQPDTYLGTKWHDYNTNSADHGGVHTNSGVQNFMFYLLATGKTGINDNGDHYDVSAISLSNIRDLAFTAHTYLWGTAEFIDARDAWIEAAGDLFGSCSNQAIQVANAWHAVGVGAQSPYYTNFVTGTITALNSNNVKEAINHVYTVGSTDINSISGAKEVRFYSGEEVTLNVGFTASSGTAFRAKVNPCSMTLHTAIRNTNPTVANDNGSMASSLLSSIVILPNPFVDQFACRLNSYDEEMQGTISVYDVVGKLILNSPCTIMKGLNEYNMDASDMKPGLYNLVINTGSGKMYSQKIVKQ